MKCPNFVAQAFQPVMPRFLGAFFVWYLLETRFAPTRGSSARCLPVAQPCDIAPPPNPIVAFDNHSSLRGEKPSFRFASSFRAPRSRVA